MCHVDTYRGRVPAVGGLGAPALASPWNQDGGGIARSRNIYVYNALGI